MPKIPRYTSRGTISARGPTAPLPVSIADQGADAIGRGMAQLGAGVSSFAQSLAKIELQRQQIRDASAISAKEFEWDKLQYNQEKLAAETDFADQADFDAFRKQYEQTMESERSRLLKGQNRRVAGALDVSFNTKSMRGLQDIDTVLHKQEREMYRTSVPAQVVSTIEQFYTSEVPKEREELDAKLAEIAGNNAGWFAEGEMERIIATQHAEVLTRLGNPDAARELIQQSGLFTATEKTTLEKGIAVRAGAVSDVQEKELSAELLRGELTTESVAMRADKMTASAAKAWSQIVVNQRSEGNPVLAAELANQATGIWKGTSTIKELELDARNAMTIDDGINGNEYKQIMAAASSELKQSQAQGLTLGYNRAKQQLVTYSDDDAFMRILEGKDITVQDLFRDRRKVEFWHLARYDDEMREWLTLNPEKTGSEFSQKAEELLYEYMNRTDAEVDQLQADRQKQLRDAGVPEKLPDDLSLYTDEQLMEAIRGG